MELPSTIHLCQSLRQLIFKVYPGLQLPGSLTPQFLMERTILSACNEDVSFINIACLKISSGETITYLAADKISEADQLDATATDRYPNEY